MARIFCAGEALIDMLPGRTDAGDTAFVPHPGGSVFNTAVALGRLGARVALISGVSHDLFGAMLAGGLTASGVETGCLIRSARPTTLAFVTLTDGEARYAFYDEATAGRMLTPDDIPALPPPDATGGALFLGGISLAVEPCASAYEALARREAGRRLIVLDPNIRPGFIADEAAFRARLGRLMALADIVKLSGDDLDWISGPEGEATDRARGLLALGPGLIVLTRGAEGAVALRPAGEVRVPARRAQVVDTVGAGDTFNAGLLASLAAAGALDRAALDAAPDRLIAEALALGVAAAAVNVTRAGANPPWKHELSESET
ncbi:carbohydrate kinase family protein [Paenirhodobacter enshiensis]|uniref:Carbohydrate kinase n=1 Tax=Paenirhodobacter enshiensis TaxID=1105367 RepID=A0A086Y750_9RHOB|nr:carbohydrate kinase [Paenirhodobacter enshiensis]KFI30100.1 carbohydrate kinase [Paenirhodobacter enshiensis]